VSDQGYEDALLRGLAERFSRHFGDNAVDVQKGWLGNQDAIGQIHVHPPGDPDGAWRLYFLAGRGRVSGDRLPIASAYKPELIDPPTWQRLRSIDHESGGELSRAFERSEDPRGRWVGAALQLPSG